MPKLKSAKPLLNLCLDCIKETIENNNDMCDLKIPAIVWELNERDVIAGNPEMCRNPFHQLRELQEKFILNTSLCLYLK